MVRAAPPGCCSASYTSTARPACARTIAAERPLGPEPMTEARSMAILIRSCSSDLGRREKGEGCAFSIIPPRGMEARLCGSHAPGSVYHCGFTTPSHAQETHAFRIRLCRRRTFRFHFVRPEWPGHLAPPPRARLFFEPCGKPWGWRFARNDASAGPSFTGAEARGCGRGHAQGW